MRMAIGQTVEIVYLDRAGKISQRKIEVLDIRDGRIRATCLTAGRRGYFCYRIFWPGTRCGGRGMPKERVILLSDCQSFYASVEKAAHPEYKDMPVAVGDPARMNGIVLAACPLAKAKGVTTASRVGEALTKCPELVVIRPRMRTYITVSLLISEIYKGYTDMVEPFSIDEQFLDVTGSLKFFGGELPKVISSIQQHVKLSTGVWTRVGVGPTKILAKMANNLAKKQTDGIFRLGYDNLNEVLWPLPVHDMFMVGGRMTKNFFRMGITTIGDIARMELGSSNGECG